MNSSRTSGWTGSVRDPGDVWAIVLAGGEGTRLRPLTRYVCGDDRPKQYAALLDSRSLLELTLDRVELAIASERTVIVARRDHTRYLAGVVDNPSRLLIQPGDRGTAVGILWPAHWISWRNPEATVAVFPSDHFVLGELTLMRHVMEVVAFVHRHPGLVVLLGAPARESEAGYGWIEPGALIGSVASEPVWRIRRFVEKPTPQAAHRCWARGDLWNTFILVAAVATLIDVGQEALPTVSDHLADLEPLADTPAEGAAIERAYAMVPTADFSRAVAQLYPARFAVSRLPAHVTWSDWGTPTRVLKSLTTAGISPPWLDRLARRGAVPA